MNATVLGMIIFAYLCGSVPSTRLMRWVAKLPEPHEQGLSTTSAPRLGAIPAAVIVLIFDILKGMLPVWVTYILQVPPLYLGITAIAACLGHIYPVFFRCRGGRGVATAFGAIAPIGWDLASLMLGTWLLTVLLSGYFSLGAIISVLIAPFYVWWFKPQFTFPVAMLSCLILMCHHDSVQRLWRGKEDKIWGKLLKKKPQKNKDTVKK